MKTAGKHLPVIDRDIVVANHLKYTSPLALAT